MRLNAAPAAFALQSGDDGVRVTIGLRQDPIFADGFDDAP